MRRLRTAACAWAVGTVFVAAAGLPSRAADVAPADRMLDGAREAVATHEFDGVVRIGWRTAEGLQWKNVEVRAVDGGLRLAHGQLVEDDGRAWLRTPDRWQTLWTDEREANTPSVVTKYKVRIDPQGPAIASRPTRVLTIRRAGHVVEEYAFDRASGLALRRVRFDDDGHVTASMTFVRLGPVTDANGTIKTPPLGEGAPQAMAQPPADARRRIGNGFALVGAQRVGGETQLLYSDGVFSASVFARDGEVDQDALPAGGEEVRIGDTQARRYRTASGTVLTWEAQGNTYTCVTDASDSELRAILASLHGDDGTWTDMVRFVTSPFSWF